MLVLYDDDVQLKDMVMLRKRVPFLIDEIQKAGKVDYAQIMLVWERSVKATHHFLLSEDFEYYKEVVPDFFPGLDLYALRSDGEIVAFMGISGENLDMLFVADGARGKGYGKTLLEFAINNLYVAKVDVNEQNIQAIRFYERFGFQIVSRSEKDSMNKDYPVLHLCLK